MNLEIENQLFVVSGATSGLGKAVAASLLAEGAHIIAIARNAENLEALQAAYPAAVETLALDIMEEDAIRKILDRIANRNLHGLLMNAGGPPAMTVMETRLEDWDKAYRSVFRWKVALTQALVPGMIANGYGRIVYIESASVKQPMENLVLSNSMRVAVVGFVKTLSREISQQGVNLNVLAPGTHTTPAIERLVKKKIEQTGVSEQAARQQYVDQTSVKALGNAADFASLATWLLSPHSRYLTGQTISVDGGTVRGIMG